MIQEMTYQVQQRWVIHNMFYMRFKFTDLWLYDEAKSAIIY